MDHARRRGSCEKAAEDARATLDYARLLETLGEAARADELYAKLQALG